MYECGEKTALMWKFNCGISVCAFFQKGAVVLSFARMITSKNFHPFFVIAFIIVITLCVYSFLKVTGFFIIFHRCCYFSKQKVLQRIYGWLNGLVKHMHCVNCR